MEQAATLDFEKLCRDRGLRMTEQRRIIAQAVAEATDHPDVERLHARALQSDTNISVATVYRTLRLMEELGLIERRDFGDGRSRFEATPDTHHDHIIDVETGHIVEFVDPELEILQRQIAARLGYRLVDHRLELYCVRASDKGGAR